MQIPGSEENPGFLIMGLNSADSRTCACEVPHQETWAHQQVPRFPGVTAVGSLARRVSLGLGPSGPMASMCHLEEVGPPPELEEPGLGTHSNGKGEGYGFPKSKQRFTQCFSKREGRPSRPFQGFSGVLFSKSA